VREELAGEVMRTALHFAEEHVRRMKQKEVRELFKAALAALSERAAAEAPAGTPVSLLAYAALGAALGAVYYFSKIDVGVPLDGAFAEVMRRLGYERAEGCEAHLAEVLSRADWRHASGVLSALDTIFVVFITPEGVAAFKRRR